MSGFYDECGWATLNPNAAPYPPRPATCECLDPYHNGQPCVREPADHSPTVVSPALCWLCLHGCEDFNGSEKVRGGEQP